MPKEILLYFPIYSSTAASFIEEMEANKGNDVCIRMNCPGGDVMASMGMIAKYNEHTGGKKVKVDGRAASMAAYFCAMADEVECLDVSEFLIHRAAFPTWVENDKNIFTDEMKGMLQRHNDMLRASLEKKIDPAKFKRMKGKSFDDVFSMDSRIDVTLTASEAKTLGLVTKVFPLNQAKKREINALASNVGIAAFYDETAEAETIIITNNKQTVMTIQDVRANAEVYNALKAEILKREKDRIAAFAAFAEYDEKAVLEAIIKGDEFSPSFGAKMQAAAIKKLGITNITNATATVTETNEVATAATDEDKAKADAAAFYNGVNAHALSHFGVKATA